MLVDAATLFEQQGWWHLLSLIIPLPWPTHVPDAGTPGHCPVALIVQLWGWSLCATTSHLYPIPLCVQVRAELRMAGVNVLGTPSRKESLLLIIKDLRAALNGQIIPVAQVSQAGDPGQGYINQSTSAGSSGGGGAASRR
jgi:hypothetical protein